MDPAPEDLAIPRGERLTIAYARRKDGSRPAKEFIDGLLRKERVRLERVFKLMASQGRVEGLAFKMLTGQKGIAEFKGHQARVFAFRKSDVWFLTNGNPTSERNQNRDDGATAMTENDSNFSWYTDLRKTEEGRRLVEQERLFAEATENICRLMRLSGLSRKELAERLGTSQSNVTQLLRGTRNLTLKSLADIFFVLGKSAHIEYGEFTDSVRIIDETRGPKLYTFEFPRTTSLRWNKATEHQLGEAEGRAV